MECGPFWSAVTCHRFGLSRSRIGSDLKATEGQSADRSAHSKVLHLRSSYTLPDQLRFATGPGTEPGLWAARSNRA